MIYNWPTSSNTGQTKLRRQSHEYTVTIETPIHSQPITENSTDLAIFDDDDEEKWSDIESEMENIN